MKAVTLTIASSLLLVAAYLAYNVVTYNLMGPNLKYGDGTYLYATGAQSFGDATNEIKVPHPGITSVLLTSWYY